MQTGYSCTGHVVRPFAHPNDLDRKRIERALKVRKRYRYVTPNVTTTVGGYRIESPCCSRNIDHGRWRRRRRVIVA